LYIFKAAVGNEESNFKTRPMMKENHNFRKDIRVARQMWGTLSRKVIDALKGLILEHNFSVTSGDLQLLDNRWYVTHAGLLRLARRSRCSGIVTKIDRSVSNPSQNRWVFRATVYKTRSSVGFAGYGDADPSNTSTRMRGAEMRIAETRAVNRALRKAYGIGLCSVEELGSLAAPERLQATTPHSNGQPRSNGSNNGQPRLRDQLCLLIRQHNLDPKLVKSYAADFCGTTTLSGASRDLVESFISHLSSAANENRESLVCKLNSYTPSSEAHA
jgi:hypothetical protein